MFEAKVVCESTIRNPLLCYDANVWTGNRNEENKGYKE